MTHETSIIVSKKAGKLLGKGNCEIIFCQSCLIEANGMLSSNDCSADGKSANNRKSRRGLKPSAKYQNSNIGASEVSSCPKVEDLHCPCSSSTCGTIGEFENARSADSYARYRASSEYSFKTFCCNQEVVFSKIASKSS